MVRLSDTQSDKHASLISLSTLVLLNEMLNAMIKYTNNNTKILGKT